MKNSSCWSAFVAIFLLPLGIWAQGLTHLEEYKLDNGLTVILNEDHTKTEVFGVMVCKAGSKDDPADATGMAHYMEHLLFKGTEELGTTDWEKEKPHIDSIFVLYDKLGLTSDEEERKKIQLLINEQSVLANEYAIPNELDKILKEMGGTDMNAYTTPDQTVYFNAFPPNQIEKWLEVYSHRFQDAVFRSFQAELEVVYEEKNRASDNFMSNLIEKVLASSFKNHPYGTQTALGTMEHLKNPSLTKMKEFYERWYVPNNMALVLSGDFDSKAVKPMIKKAFESWESKEVQEHGTWEEQPFSGREVVEVRMSPIKLGLLGFRTVPMGHPDYVTIEVCNSLLSNTSGSGLLDKLATEHKLLAAQSFPFPFSDHGINYFLFVPKIVGQSLEEAEQLVLAELDSFKQGKFEDWRLEAVKKEMYRTHMESLERNMYRGTQLAENFSRGEKATNLRDYPEQVNAITKDDILRVANEYFGENYLAFLSKMGSGKGEKIDKPNYEPVVSNTDAVSEFGKKIESMSESEFKPTYLDFDKDVQSASIQEGVTLYRCENPVNDVFTLDIRINAGEEQIDLIEHVIAVMDMAYTEEYGKQELKNEMSKIGASYYFTSSGSYTTLHITGLEEDLDRALELVNGLLVNPKLDDSEIDVLLDYVKTDRKFEDNDPPAVADAAVDWVKYGEKSDYLDRLSLKEVKDLEIKTLLGVYNKLRLYSVELHYVGKKPINEVKEIVSNRLQFESNLMTPDLPVVRPVNQWSANQVYFIHKKNAVQSQVHFLQNGRKIDIPEIPQLEAFNLYFGGGFSGLVLQEIREYRSLAYTAGARYGKPERLDTPVLFRGYIGTQADKTNDAIGVFMDLVQNMPDKQERINTIQKYLTFSSVSEQPGFRETIPYVLKMKRLGYTEPPALTYRDEYSNLQYADIRNFYENNIRKTPTVIVVVGDKKKVDVKSLEQFGVLTKLKMKKLYSK